MIKKRTFTILSLLTFLSLGTLGFSTFFVSTYKIDSSLKFNVGEISSTVSNFLSFNSNYGSGTGVIPFSYVNQTDHIGFVNDGMIGNTGKISFYMILNIQSISETYIDQTSKTFTFNLSSSSDYIFPYLSSVNVEQGDLIYYSSSSGSLPMINNFSTNNFDNNMQVEIQIANLNLNAAQLYFSFDLIFNFTNVADLFNSLENIASDLILSFEVF